MGVRIIYSLFLVGSQAVSTEPKPAFIIAIFANFSGSRQRLTLQHSGSKSQSFNKIQVSYHHPLSGF